MFKNGSAPSDFLTFLQSQLMFLLLTKMLIMVSKVCNILHIQKHPPSKTKLMGVRTYPILWDFAYQVTHTRCSKSKIHHFHPGQLILLLSNMLKVVSEACNILHIQKHPLSKTKLMGVRTYPILPKLLFGLKHETNSQSSFPVHTGTVLYPQYLPSHLSLFPFQV